MNKAPEVVQEMNPTQPTYEKAKLFLGNTLEKIGQAIVSFGDRIKAKESVYTSLTIDPDTPFCVRLDGKAFHTYTRGLKRPFDERLSKAMVETMNYMVEKTEARIGYTQSDEISLVFYKLNPAQQHYLGGRVQKLTSIFAAMATAKFNDLVRESIPEKSGELAFFDARVWSVDNLDEAAEVFVWRQEDAIKNAISMAAHAVFGAKKILKKNSQEKIAMLAEAGFDWEKDYPEFFKMGTFAMRKNVTISVELPEDKKKYQDGSVAMRTVIENFYLPRIRIQSGWAKILFAPVEEEYRKAVAFRNSRVKKVD